MQQVDACMDARHPIPSMMDMLYLPTYPHLHQLLLAMLRYLPTCSSTNNNDVWWIDRMVTPASLLLSLPHIYEKKSQQKSNFMRFEMMMERGLVLLYGVGI